MLELAIREPVATLAHVLKQKALELRPRWWGAGRLGGPRAGQTHVRFLPDTEKLSQSHRCCTCSAIHNQRPDSSSLASRSPLRRVFRRGIEVYWGKTRGTPGALGVFKCPRGEDSGSTRQQDSQGGRGVKGSRGPHKSQPARRPPTLGVFPAVLACGPGSPLPLPRLGTQAPRSHLRSPLLRAGPVAGAAGAGASLVAEAGAGHLCPAPRAPRNPATRSRTGDSTAAVSPSPAPRARRRRPAERALSETKSARPTKNKVRV